MHSVTLRTGSLVLWLSMLYSFSFGQTKAEKYFLQGRSKYERGSYKPAIKWLDKSIDLDTNIAKAFAYRGAARIELFQLEGAMKDLDRAIVKDPSVAFAWYSRGRANSQMFAHDQALSDLNKAIELNNTEPKYYYARAAAHAAAKDPDAAITDFEKVIDLDSLYYRAYRELGTLQAQKMDTIAAKTNLDKAIALAPTDPVCYNSRGFHLKAAYGNHKSALEDFGKAIKLNPNYAYAFNNRGFSRYKVGEVSKGIKDIELSLKKREDNAWAYRNLNVIYSETGDKNGACSSAIRALELNYTEQFDNAMQEYKDKNCQKRKNKQRPRNAP